MDKCCFISPFPPTWRQWFTATQAIGFSSTYRLSTIELYTKYITRYGTGVMAVQPKPIATMEESIQEHLEGLAKTNSCLLVYMMTSSSGNTFRVTGLLCEEFTGHRWIPHTKASDAELWCLLWRNGWVNNGAAGDLKRQRVRYDVTVMNKSHE